MKRFKSPRHVQRFLSTHHPLANPFPRRRDHDTAANLRSGRTQAFATRADVTGVAIGIITRIAGHRPAHRTFRQSVDAKLTVPCTDLKPAHWPGTPLVNNCRGPMVAPHNAYRTHPGEYSYWCVIVCHYEGWLLADDGTGAAFSRLQADR
jgi:hypothetical protein